MERVIEWEAVIDASKIKNIGSCFRKGNMRKNIEKQNFEWRRNDMRNTSKMTEKKCYNCGDRGHMANACKKLEKCYKCGELGHISYQCEKSENDNNNFETKSNSNVDM